MEIFYKGIPGSGSIAMGTAVVFLKSNLFVPRYSIARNGESIQKEIDKLETALEKTKDQLEELKNELIQNQSPLETGYLDTTILMLDDPLIRERVAGKLSESFLNIEWIFNEVIDEVADELGKSEDAYFSERAPDVISVGNRVLKNLLGREEGSMPKFGKNPIVVAHTLSPLEVVSLYKRKVAAFITEIGGRTSHVAIMARDMRIPAVVGVEDITRKVQTGDTMIVDGTIGTLIVNPEEDTIQLYRFKQEDQLHRDKKLKKIEKKPCVLKEGIEINLLANMDLEEELHLVLNSGSIGVGLFRTEYIFLNRLEAPNEDEQFSIYKNIVRTLRPREVTIRVIDIGGDKKPDYMKYVKETNPFLGLRGIRYALSYPHILKTQMKAILRAGAWGKARIMFPMVNDLDEMQRILLLMEECKRELEERKEKYNADIPVGIMVETPSSVLLLDRFAEQASFVSVGTNDLIQYTLAIDRGNGMVAGEFDPMHPAILRSLKMIQTVAVKNGMEVSICGEMAGDPLYTLLLIGLGYRKLSMSAMGIPIVKSVIIDSSLESARQIAEKALSFNLKREVGRYVRDEMISRFKYLEDYFR